MDPRLKELLDAATLPYRAAGRYAWHFARGKLRHDPVFFALLRRGLLPDEGSLLDLGCGRGVLLALLMASRTQHAAGRWPRDWPAPPTRLALSGIDAHPARVQLARRVLGAGAQVEVRDVRALTLGPCSVVAIFDVLLYLDESEQERVLDAAAAALAPGGLLLLREADAGAGAAFHATRASAWLEAALRGELAPRLRFRSAAAWTAALGRRGFAVDAQPMSRGTPFANVLFAARKVV